MNIVGYTRAEMGIGESSRLAAQAADAAGVPFSMHDFNVGNRSRLRDIRWASRMADENRHWINVFHINADQMPIAAKRLGAGFFAGHYNIAFWHWELPEFPDCWVPSFKCVDEVWAPANFVVETLRRKSPVPVLRMPHGIYVPADPTAPRASMGLPESPFLFLAMYDTHSFQARKNPQAAIEAFFRAFPRPRNAAMVVKINNPASHPDQVERLRAQLQGRPGIILLDKNPHPPGSLQPGGGLRLFRVAASFRGVRTGAGRINVPRQAGHRDRLVWQSGLHESAERLLRQLSPGPRGQRRLWGCGRGPDLGRPGHRPCGVVHETIGREPLAEPRIGCRGRETIRSEFSPEAVGRMCRQRLEAVFRQHGKTRQLPAGSGETPAAPPMQRPATGWIASERQLYGHNLAP